jgi:hypothetical protein
MLFARCALRLIQLSESYHSLRAKKKGKAWTAFPFPLSVGDILLGFLHHPCVFLLPRVLQARTISLRTPAFFFC